MYVAENIVSSLILERRTPGAWEAEGPHTFKLLKQKFGDSSQVHEYLERKEKARGEAEKEEDVKVEEEYKKWQHA